MSSGERSSTSCSKSLGSGSSCDALPSTSAFGQNSNAVFLASSFDFAQQTEPLVRCGPLRAGDMLVEVLAGSHAEEEAPGHEARHSRCGVSDDRRMDADRRTRDPGSDAELRGRMRNPAQHRPDESAVALL